MKQKYKLLLVFIILFISCNITEKRYTIITPEGTYEDVKLTKLGYARCSFITNTGKIIMVYGTFTVIKN
jgi:hypothetical protein